MTEESSFTDPFAGREEQDRLLVKFVDGNERTGAFMRVAGMSFLHETGTHLSPLGEVHGPFDLNTISEVTVLKSRESVFADRRERAMGDLVPGRQPITAEDYRYRLELLAREMVRAQTRERRDEIERQFHEVADLIKLAQPKRTWIILEAAWLQKSNCPPELADLWFDDIASPSRLRRPRAQDFDPDPKIRARRNFVPEVARLDPLSVPNVMRRLKASGLKPRIACLGEPDYARASLVVPFPVAGRAQYVLNAKRGVGGAIAWSASWDGNYSRTGRRRLAAVKKLDLYQAMMAAIDIRRAA